MPIDPFSSWVSKYDVGTQYLGSLIGTGLMLLSLVGYSLYTILQGEQAIGWKIFIGFNALCGILILWSMFVTTYQQYLSYKEVEVLNKINEAGSLIDVHVEDKEVKGGIECQQEDKK
jgi:hypothetical protein